MIELNAVQTVAFGGMALFLGYALCRVIPVLGRYNLPAPVIGGLVIALLVLWAHGRDTVLFQFDTALQGPLMVAFFTSMGVNASVALLKVSGRQVMVFLALASGFAVVQNLVGIGVATSFGLDPMFGVLAGSATLTGGPATGLAFAPLFEQAGLAGAESIAITSAMAGIVCGGIVGGPAITVLIRRLRLRPAAGQSAEIPAEAAAEIDLAVGDGVVVDTEAAREYNALKSIVVILLAMWVGAWVGKGFDAIGLTLPVYIGAMLVGAVIRNFDDRTGWVGLSVQTTDLIGNVCLALFLAVALMNLKLWELSGLA
jgi:ESS family glutamate:Na+ symporter